VFLNQLKVGKGLKYIVIGAGVVNIFLQLANFVMLFYSIVLVGTSISLIQFSVVGVVSFAVTFYIIGYIWRNHSDMFRADRMVDAETDPYQTEMYVKVMTPIWKIFVKMAKGEEPSKEDIEKVEQYIKNSEENKK
jgi:hypothetical protein